MRKAYMYCRDCNINGCDSTINAQQGKIRDFAKANGIEVVGMYIDKSKSGANTKRDGYQKMLCDLAENHDVTCIVVSSLDRLHRNVREQLNMIYELKDKGIRILTTTGIDTMDKECMSEIPDEACQAEKYYSKLSDK